MKGKPMVWRWVFSKLVAQPTSQICSVCHSLPRILHTLHGDLHLSCSAHHGLRRSLELRCHGVGGHCGVGGGHRIHSRINRLRHNSLSCALMWDHGRGSWRSPIAYLKRKPLKSRVQKNINLGELHRYRYFTSIKNKAAAWAMSLDQRDLLRMSFFACWHMKCFVFHSSKPRRWKGKTMNVGHLCSQSLTKNDLESRLK